MTRVDLEKHRTFVLLALLIGIAVVLWFLPDTALADDCERDPFDAEDCLRTSVFAPLIAAGVAGLTALLASLGEIRNTITSFSERVSQGAVDAANVAAGHDRYIQTSANAGPKVPHGPSGWWDWINKGLGHAQRQNPAADTEKLDRDRDNWDHIRQFARDSEKPVRVVFGIAGAGLALGTGTLLGVGVGIGLIGIAVFYPDILGPVLDFHAGKDESGDFDNEE